MWMRMQFQVGRGQPLGHWIQTQFYGHRYGYRILEVVNCTMLLRWLAPQRETRFQAAAGPGEGPARFLRTEEARRRRCGPAVWCDSDGLRRASSFRWIWRASRESVTQWRQQTRGIDLHLLALTGTSMTVQSASAAKRGPSAAAAPNLGAPGAEAGRCCT